MSLYLYNSNRLEILAEAFNTLVSENPLPPILPELVVLQSGGMARWLSMQVAERSGVCANLDCPFPNQFVDRIFRKVLGDDISKTFEQEILQWQLMRILPTLLDEPGFGPLKAYLNGARDVKLFRLAGRIADLFDQYTIFRPEMIMAWEEGGGDGWQALLWNHLRKRDDCLRDVTHRAVLRDRVIEVLAGGSGQELLEQGRFSIFGLSSIPLFHLEILTALSAYLDVHFFFMNPCREFWDDIVPGKLIDKFSIGHHKEPEELHFHEGNPLLASSGRQGREMISILHKSGEWEEFDLYDDPLDDEAEVSALRIIQSDILNLRSVPSEEFIISPSDCSIQYHSCQSSMRELEVLYDQLLKMFMQYPGLEPKDILVMVPDIDFYSPMIQAVFKEREESYSVPFSIADRKLRSEGGLVRAFQDLLDIRKSRMEVSRVLTILEHDAVRRRFSLTSDDLERIEKWLSEVNIRWAVDQESKIEMGLPGTYENTWRQGLDRLLLGYAMSGEGYRSFAGILPADNVEGNETEILGRFIDFTEMLFSFRSEIAKKRQLNGWADLLTATMAEMVEPDSDQQREFTQLVKIFASLKEQKDKADFAADVDFEVIQSFLDNYLAEGGLSTGFMTGAVTFCELLPMRAVPFRCICLLGMNEGDFPRITSAPGFDLIASHPKIGDRSKKSDDRYLFLETILSARETLYISYIGQSIKDGSTLLPSLLVSELQDYLAPLADKESGKGKYLPTCHPMHSFSKKYFVGDEQLINFSQDDFQASRSLSVNEASSVLVTEELPELPDEQRVVELENLVRFFKNPTEFFCRHRLGIGLDRSGQGLDGTESFTLDSLQRYKTGNWLLEQTFSGSPVADGSEILRLQGTMPHGNVGKVEIARLEDEVRCLADKTRSFRAGGSELLAEGVLEVGGFNISGEIYGCIETGKQVISRFAKVNAADEVSGWIRHLFYNCLADDGQGRQTIIVGNDKVILFDEVADGHAFLSDLLELYWRGMRKPLSLFPRSSLAYCEILAKKGEREAIAKAESVWRGSDFSRGEGDDPYYKLCLRETFPFSDKFPEIAIRFFAPLIEKRSSA